MTSPTRGERIAGCLFGLALGDALGAPTEFLSVAQILTRFAPSGPQAPPGTPARVTDDTQMTLAMGEALVACLEAGELTPARAAAELTRTFLAWYRSPDNDRAPGGSCLSACRGLELGLPWVQATTAGSKGCGANMRVAPAAFAPAEARAGLSQLQAALTHGHPTALAAADLTSLAVADLAAGGDLPGLPDRLAGYARLQREVYREDWLGEVWRRHGASTAADYARRGWDECLAALERLQQALRRPDRERDPCLATGDGWIAEEALATGLHCLLLFPRDPLAGLRRAAVTRGDSDSIACLTGAFAGAAWGLAAWPPDWVERIEYRGRIGALAEALTRLDA